MRGLRAPVARARGFAPGQSGLGFPNSVPTQDSRRGRPGTAGRGAGASGARWWRAGGRGQG